MPPLTLILFISELTYATGGTDEKTQAMIDEVLNESHHFPMARSQALSVGI